MVRLSRREALAAGASAVAIASLGIAPAKAANDSADLIRKFTGGKAATEGKVKLDLPEIAENGNTVPMTVMVESPMTDASHVTEVLVVGDGNPNGGMATFHFSPASGVAEANTRIRLAATQKITAKEVKVTIGGCGG